LLYSENRLLLEGGRLKVDGDFDASSEVYIAGGNCIIEVGGVLTGISSVSNLKADLISDPSVTLILNGPDAIWDTESAGGSSSGPNIGPTTIKVTNGGTMIGGSSAFYGDYANSVEITGTGSQWITGVLEIGEYGKRLAITDGGAVSSSRITMGDRFAGGNIVTVSGSGSELNTGWVVVGYRGGGGNRILVEDGGRISSSGGQIGDYRNSHNNSVEVSGAGSQWSISGNLTVGVGGYGSSLIISDGGIVSNSVGRIGMQSDGSIANNSSVTVSGAGSMWHNDGSLTVGYSEATDSRLVIADGGRVENTDSFVGSGSYNITALVSGAGSKWNNTGTVTIGSDWYTGSKVIVTNGGEVVAGAGISIIGSGNSMNLEQGGRLTIGADFDASMDGFNYNSGGTLSVLGQLSGLSTLEIERRLEANDVLGDLTVHGTFAPGNSPADSILDGILSVASDGTLEMELAGLLLGDEYDRLTVTDTAYLDGTLDIALLDGFTLSYGDSFDLFNWVGEVVGEFDTITTAALTGDLQWDTSGLYTCGTLTVIPEPAALSLIGLVAGGIYFTRRLFPPI